MSPRLSAKLPVSLTMIRSETPFIFSRLRPISFHVQQPRMTLALVAHCLPTAHHAMDPKGVSVALHGGEQSGEPPER